VIYFNQLHKNQVMPIIYEGIVLFEFHDELFLILIFLKNLAEFSLKDSSRFSGMQVFSKKSHSARRESLEVITCWMLMHPKAKFRQYCQYRIKDVALYCLESNKRG